MTTSPPEEAQRTELLAEVRGSVLHLLAELPRLPERLRVSARDIVVELEWPSVPSAGLDLPVATTVTGDDTPAGHRVTAPTVGTFYRSPEPGAAPFVEVGDVVKAGQQVAILEAMKLMLPVESDVDGLVVEICRQDGESVEYGQPLLVLERA